MQQIKTTNTNDMKSKSSGERLKYIRELTSLSRAKLAEETKLSASSVEAWESDKIKLSNRSISRIIKAYKSLGLSVSAEWIISGVGQSPLLETVEEQQGSNSEILKMLNLKSPTFIAYMDRHERFLFVNNKYEEIFNMPASEIVGKKLKDMVGEQGYRIGLPFLKKALMGIECKFEYPWLNQDKGYRYLKLHYIPDIIEHNGKKRVKGFYTFIEDAKEKQEVLSLNEISTLSPDINNFLPNTGISPESTEYDHKLYMEIASLVSRLLGQYKIKYNYAIATKIIDNVYLFSSLSKEANTHYAEAIIRMAIQAGYLYCT